MTSKNKVKNDDYFWVDFACTWTMTGSRERLKNIKWYKNRYATVAGGSGKPKVLIGNGTLPATVRNSRGEISEFDIPNVRVVENFGVFLIKPQELYKAFGFEVDMHSMKLLDENARVIADIR
jgi:hypothetical protein